MKKNEIKDGIGTRGRFKLDCFLADGTMKWSTGWILNGTTTAGMAQLALLAGDAAAVPFTFLGLGTSSTSFASSQTTLVAEIVDSGLERAAATVSRVTTTNTDDTLQLTKTFTATGSKTIEEIGYFNAISAGTMGGRALTTTKTIANGETIVATYQIKFT